MSHAHHAARNSAAPIISTTPTPLTTDDRTLMRVVWIGSPSSVVTVTVTGKVPGLRVSTRIRSV